MKRFFPAFGSAMFFLSCVAVSAQGVTNFGTIEFAYMSQDGAHLIERRNIDMDAFVASDGSNVAALQSVEKSVCNLLESPLIPDFPPTAPPPNSRDIPPSTSMVEIYQLPLDGVHGWYQKIQYYRAVHPNPDGTWDSPGPWSNPLKNQVHAQIPNLSCDTSSE